MSYRKHDDKDVMIGADGLPIYGMDKEIRAKVAAKYDREMERQARAWMEELLGQKWPSDDLQTSLKDGILLCKLVNAIKPNMVKRINTSKLPFMQMENINAFLKAAAELGVPKHDLFVTVDLYEGKNIPQVIQALFSLGSITLKMPGYKGPIFGKKRADKTEIHFTEEQLLKAKAEVSLLSTGSNKVEMQKSISHEVVKVQDTGVRGVTSQLSEGSKRIEQQRSIRNEVVKVVPTTTSKVKVVEKTESEPEVQVSGFGGSLEDLEHLAELRDKGLLTDEEFEQKKKQILGL